MTLKQIAQEIRIPESTLRLQRDAFAEFVPATGEGRRRRYDAIAARTLKQIAEWKKSGVSTATIRQELSRTQTPMETKRTETLEERMAQLLTILLTQGGEMALLRAEVGALRGELGRLVGLLSAERAGTQTMETVQREQLPLASPPS